MLHALVWKDARVNRLPLIACAALLIAPYAVVAAAVMQLPIWMESTTSSAWAVLLATGSYFSVMCSQATLTILSGNLIAAERSDRSAEFLAYLPPSRRQLLASKALLLLLVAVVVWGTNLVIQMLADMLAADADAGARTLTADMASLGTMAAIGSVAIAAGWCASCMLSAAGTAVGLAVCAPLLLGGLFQASQLITGWPDELSFPDVYFIACWLTAVTLFVAGSVYYLRRIEP
jgi:ABC-type transport system involved in multi-copper enzyme maturation permease subunit